MKICFVIGGYFFPTCVDDFRVKHDSALLIEDEKQTVRISLGMNRDVKLSKPYEPYYGRVVTLEKLIQFRDQLTDLIDQTTKDEALCK